MTPFVALILAPAAPPQPATAGPPFGRVIPPPPAPPEPGARRARSGGSRWHIRRRLDRRVCREPWPTGDSRAEPAGPKRDGHDQPRQAGHLPVGHRARPLGAI